MREVALGSRAGTDGSPRGGTEDRAPRYWAFLSYSHKDSEVADWLHGALEKYRVPRALVGRETARGVIPAGFSPIFRDRHELAASGDLGHTIREALAASRCLIVLCSPEAARSRWTNEEIIAFKKAHPNFNVLAAIVDGEPFASEVKGHEPEECFPPALREKFDSRGRPTGRRAEPIAADFRPTGDGRQLGLLKIVAGMIGVGLDDLIRREQQRRHKRLTYIAAASLAGMTITSGLAVFAFDKRDEARDQRREAEGLVGFMLGDLRQKLEPIGRLDALDAVGSRALAYFEKQDKSELSDDALAQRSKALTLMGEIAQTTGDLDGALKHYREALATTAESVRRYPDNPQGLFDHAQNVFWVGYIDWQRGRAQRAADRFREYQRLADRMASLEPDNKDYRLEQIYANTNLGTVLMDQRRYREAARTYDASVRAGEALASSEPRNLDYQKQVINALGWLADAREYSGQLEQALATRERQLRLVTQIAHSNPGDMQLQRDTMTALRSIGRLLGSRGDVRGGIRESLRGVAVSEQLFQVEPDNTEWLQANVTGRFDLVDLQLAAGQVDQAAVTIRSACDIVDRLAQRNTSVIDWKTVKRVSCLSARGRLALQENAPAEAFSLASQAVAAAQGSPKPIERGMLNFRALALGSDALAALRRRNESIAWAKRALQAIPAEIELRPAEMAMAAPLQLRIGNRAAAERMISALAAAGYRNPSFLRELRRARG
ncbi:MAG TPA: TIR domain-containing protein [Sphingomicrobium sp.]|nr:TIR domain-containing protein [Sphingomicrobium sp.]